VHRLARELELSGSVRNGSDGAEIEIEGEAVAVAEFERRLAQELPPLARLAELEVRELEPLGSTSFHVGSSALGARRRALIPPDARLCDACRAEMETPGDRRFHYAFTTCTDCGPRFSLLRSLPYDRGRTSMAPFPLCPSCAAEYEDIQERRYHAEPLCCPACGPQLWLSGPELPEPLMGPEAVARARDELRAGRILAVKGLGGFQLACRADDEAAVLRLRRTKRRPTQPLAVMARDLDVARRLVHLDAAGEALLLSPESPILLAPRRAGKELSPLIAPGLNDLGVLLPTTPLHVELFRAAGYDALVMTSGNAHHEPIARRDDEALVRLGGCADFFLTHEREVVRRVDDSVVRTSPEGPLLLRRSRGYVPAPLALPEATPQPILALGGYLQTTACLAQGEEAFLSQHVGDLDTCQARDFLHEVCAGLEDFLEVRPRVLAVDEHPDYPSTWLGESLAQERGGRLVRVQHHLAHAAAVLAENGAFPARGAGAVGALVLDGTGYGLDGSAWGSEWLLLDGELEWRRAAHGEALTLVGGTRAIREPWRILASVFARRGEAEALVGLLPELAKPFEDVARLMCHDGWPRASGAGRVFEAAGVLFGLCTSNSWEGEAAALFEACADGADGEGEVWLELGLEPGSRVLPSGALLVAAARRLLEGEDPARTALGFHRTFAVLAAELSARVLARATSTIALGGGCLVNRHLRRCLRREHEARGFDVWLPSRVPPGDGGLAYGQVVLAGACLARDLELRYAGDH
jgi:hydrogenase maturation protein HypF